LAAAALFVVALSIGRALSISAAVSNGDDESLTGKLSPVAVVNPSPRDVQFVLIAPNARKVAVVGDFNDWDTKHAAYQAEHRGGGVWSVTAPVPVGHHRYSFVVDDSVWVTDPTAPRVLDEDYGRPNSALVVGESAP
jgi:1,4-alpha-glucan branching enzyme